MKISSGAPGRTAEDGFISDEAEAEAAEAMADPDYEGDPGQIFSADDVIDPGIIQDSKKVNEILERRRIRELQERYPDSDLDWSREYASVHGDVDEVGYRYQQGNRYFDHTGKEVFYPEEEKSKN
jgi:hypothetical protein